MPDGSIKHAAEPSPSTLADALHPANLDTAPLDDILRMLKLLRSVTKTTKSVRMHTACGQLNPADVPTPSRALAADPATPPANVVTVVNVSDYAQPTR